jgi:hypothetical protein
MIRMQMTRIIAIWMAGLLFAAQPCMAMVVGYCRAGGSAWTTILSDGFDGDFSLWTSETDVNTIGAVSGSAYVVTMAAPAQVAYLNKTFASPAPYAHVRWDFYASLSDVTAVGNAAGQTIRVAQGGNGSNETMFSVSARCSAAGGDVDQIQFGYHNGTAATTSNQTFAWVAGQSHHIVAEYYAADGGLGFATLSVDGVQLVNATGLSNSARTFDRAKLGVALNSMAAAPTTVSVQGVVYAIM